MANTYKATFELDAQVQGVIDGFTKIQDAAKKLNLGKAFDNKLEDMMTRLTKNGQKMSEAIQSGFKKTSDLTKFKTGMSGVESTITSIVRLIEGIDPKKLALGGPELDNTRKQLEALNEEFKKLSGEFQKSKEFKNFENFLKSVDSSKHSTKALQQFYEALKGGDIDQIDMQMKGLENTFKLVQKRSQSGSESMKFWETAVELATKATQKYTTNGANILIERDEVAAKVIEQETAAFQENERIVNELKTDTKDYADNTHRLTTELDSAADKSTDLNKTLEHFKSRAEYFLGMENGVRLFRRAVRSAFNDVKSLDKAMTATAVVTNFSVGDMWAQLPEYTKRANALGASIQDVYEASTLFYQQGLKTNEVVALSTEALKMARIAGLDAATATDRMTNALRGFNMEINEQSAQRINDVYSALAARTASNVDEISTAMTKVASLANNANMSFEKTSAFLSQIIETTRESAETAGTALKTVVARFSEVKELYSKGELLGTDSEGEEIQVNRVAKALQTAGISLNEYFTGVKGLDDIFMELASKWDDLDEVQQRYIATMAAGSRQQSRFIAMMQDYKRTVELVDIAENAAGESTKQFEKTLDSLDAKLNTLKNSWTTFTTGIANQSVIKRIVDLLRSGLDVINNITGKLPGFLKVITNTGLLFGGLKLGRKLFDNLFLNAGKLLHGEAIKHAGIYGSSFAKGLTKIKMFPANFASTFIQPNMIKSMASYKDEINKLIGASKNFNLTGAEQTQIQKRLNTLTAVRRNVVASELTEEQKALVLSAAQKDSNLAEALSEKQLTTEEIKETAAQNGLNLSKKMGIATILKYKIATLGGASADQIAAAAKEGLTLKQAGLTAAFRKGIAVLGLYALAIMAVVGAIVLIVQLWKGGDRIAQRWNDMAADQSSIISELSDKYTDLKDRIDNLKQSYSVLNTMTVGTDTWKEKVDELNTSVDELITKYPQFAQYFESKNGVMTLKEGAEGKFNEQLGVLESQKNMLQTSTPLVNAMAEYGQAIKAGNHKAVGAGIGIGLADFATLGLANMAIGPISSAIDKEIADKYDEIRKGLQGNFQLAFAEGQDRDLANLLINNDQAMKSALDAMTWTDQTNLFGGRKKFKNWDKNIKKEWQQFQEEMYAGGRIGEGGGIYDVNGELVKNAEAIYAIWKVQKQEQKKIDKAKTDMESNPFIKRLIEGKITEEDFQTHLRTTELRGELDEIYNELGWQMYNLMQSLGTALYDAGFSSDTINTMSLDLRQKIGDILSSIPLTSKKTFARLYEELWAGVDDASKEDVLKVLKATNFNDAASLNTLKEELLDILGDGSIENIEGFISGVEQLGIVTLALTKDISAVIKATKEIEKVVKGETQRINGETYDDLSKKVQGMFLKVGEDEYIYIENNTASLQKAQAEDVVENLRESIITIPNIKSSKVQELRQQRADAVNSVKFNPELTTDEEFNRWTSSALSKKGYKNPIAKTMAPAYAQLYRFYALGGIEDLNNYNPSSLESMRAFKEKYGMTYGTAAQAFSGKQQDKTMSIIWDIEAEQQAEYRKKAADAVADLVDPSEYEAEGDKAVEQAVNETKQKIRSALVDGNYDILEAMALNDNVVSFIEEYMADEITSVFQGVINEDSSLFGLNTSDKRFISKTANVKESGAKSKQIQTAFDKLNDLKYFLEQGPIEDYASTYAEAARLMSQVFGQQVDTKWINENTELLLNLLDNTENYGEALEEFRMILQEQTDQDILLLNTDFDEMGQAIIDTTTIADVEAYTKALEEAGYAVTLLADGNLLVKDSLLSLLHASYLSSQGSSSKNDQWENPYDRLHNLLEHITRVQKERNQLEHEYTKELRNQDGSQKKTSELMQQRLNNLYAERELQAKLRDEREKEMDDYYEQHKSEIGKYAYYKDDGRVYIDWNALENANFTNDEGKNIEDIISKMKELRDSRDDAVDKLNDIDDDVYDTKQTIIENYRNFEDRVLAAVTADEQKRIDMMSKINDSINDATDKLFDQAQKQIDEYRQTRENEKTESEIADKEARLAYLRRDTSGANALEIKKLEEELGDARQDYADSRIDQALEEMRNEADLAAEQRAEQIAIEQGILEYQKTMGLFWREVELLIRGAFNSDGKVNFDSDLIKLLQETEGFQGLSELGKSEWIKQVNSEMLSLLDEATLRRILYGTENGNQTVVTPDDLPKPEINVEVNLSDKTWQTKDSLQSSLAFLQSSTFPSLTAIGGWKSGDDVSILTSNLNILQNFMNTVANFVDEIYDNPNLTAAEREYFLSEQFNLLNYIRDAIVNGTNKLNHFSTGGLVQSTGPAWLDGTRSNPEYVLNAAQTEGFLQLVDMFTKPQDAFSGTPGFGDNYFDIDINAEIGSDYDVDQLVERIKTRITEDSMYRNVNAINFIR